MDLCNPFWSAIVWGTTFFTRGRGKVPYDMAIDAASLVASAILVSKRLILRAVVAAVNRSHHRIHRLIRDPWKIRRYIITVDNSSIIITTMNNVMRLGVRQRILVSKHHLRETITPRRTISKEMW